MNNIGLAKYVADQNSKAIVHSNKSRRNKKASQFCVKLSNCERIPGEESKQNNPIKQAKEQQVGQTFKCFKCFGRRSDGQCRECLGSTYISASHYLVQHMERILAKQGQRDCDVVKHIKKEYLLLPHSGTDVINQQSFSVQDQHSIFSKGPDRQSDSEGACDLETKPIWVQSPDLGVDQLRRSQGSEPQGSVNNNTKKSLSISLRKDTGAQPCIGEQMLIKGDRGEEGSDFSGLDSSFVKICKDWSQSYEAPGKIENLKEDSFRSLKSSQSRISNYDISSKARNGDNRAFFEQVPDEDSELEESRVNSSKADCSKNQRLSTEGRLNYEKQSRKTSKRAQIRKLERNGCKKVQGPEGISSLSYGQGEEIISIKILPRQNSK